MERDTLRTALHVAATGFVLAAVALAVLVAAPSVVGAEASYVVLSDSMSPHIQAGDLVVVRATEPADLEEGDVITFRTGANGAENPVTHRIVAVERTDEGLRFQTKGDANEEPEQSPVTPAQVVGKVWFHVPIVGRVVVFAGTRAGLITLVVVPSVLLVASELHSLYRDLEEPDPPAPDGDGDAQ